MNTTKLTDAQKNGLRYYLAVETKTNRIGKFKSRFKHPDPRVIEALSNKGFLAVDGYYYGPIWKLTDAGRALAQTLETA